MATRKNETGKPAAPLALKTKDELTEDEMARVSGGQSTGQATGRRVEKPIKLDPN
jgi:bacteriocin-like protein